MGSDYHRKKVGIVLSGAGVFDGTEIHEATLTALYLDKLGIKPIFMAPNVNQQHTINHSNQEEQDEGSRNVLVESARIARGPVKDIKDAQIENLDAVIFPGGFGAAKNLSDFSEKGSACSVQGDVEDLVKKMHEAKKPLGFMCIAPVIAAKVLGDVTLTIGKDVQTAQSMEEMGATHQSCDVENIVEDKERKIVSTPAYMLGPSISKISVGIERLVSRIAEMIEQQHDQKET